jgi:hypothetical protein
MDPVNADLARRFERLEDRRQDLLVRLEEHDRVRLNRPRADGGWSALQVLHHVITAEEGTRRYISKKMLGGTTLPPAGLVSRLRRLTLQAANGSPFRFKAPAVTAAVPPDIDPKELRARWQEVRTDWRTLLESFPEELLDRMVFRHAMVGLMGLPDTLAFLQSHLAHHGRQVERLLNE